MTKTILKKHKGMALAIPLFILLYGCAYETAGGKEMLRKNNGAEAGFFIKDVPFFPQERYHCGPASLASVMNYYGILASEEDVAKEVYNPKLSGALSMDMLNYARSKGLEASYSKASLEDVKKEIVLNRPVILFLDLGYSFYPVRHYMVVTGYNDAVGYLTAHSGIEKDKIFSYKELQTAWEKTGFGAVFIRPKGK